MNLSELRARYEREEGYSRLNDVETSADRRDGGSNL